MPECDAETLLASVPEDGTAVGNIFLIRTLGWDEDVYWEVRNSLVDRGILEVGRGRGGSVRRVIQEASESVSDESGTLASEAPSEEQRERESDLYEPLAEVLAQRWVKDKRVESSIVQVTAHQGRRPTGGMWSRPDLAVATLATYPYVPGRHFDVVTFEVKPSWAIDITAVYEALGHLRSATRSYVLLHVCEDEKKDVKDVVTDICAEAKRHGIGVITFGRPDRYDSWDELVEPVRYEPEARKLNDFLATQFSSEQREKLLKRFR
jgi:hypothetical protein